MTDDGKGLRWWKNEQEFAEYAKMLKPIGWEDKGGKEEEPVQEEAKEEKEEKEEKFDDEGNPAPLPENRPAKKRKAGGFHEAEEEGVYHEEEPPKKRPAQKKSRFIEDEAECSDEDDEDDADEGDKMADFIDDAPQADEFFGHAAVDNACDYVVYILENDQGDSYPGMTNNMARRLRQHNGEISGGAQVTVAAAQAGHLWRFFGFFSGFVDMRHALRFEAALRHAERRSAAHAFEMGVTLSRKVQYTGVRGHRA